MSEFKFSCPACGQDILCDSTHAGKDIGCPICKAIINVPAETAMPTDVATPEGTPPPGTGYNATTAQRTSRLAIASLVCSLSSLITCVGWLPGIICGHLAKSRIRRDSSLKGGGLATAGLIIGYLILMLEVGTAAVRMWQFSAAVKQGFENVRQDLATNHVLVTQIQSTTVSNENKPPEPRPPEPVTPATAAATNPPIEPGQSGWTADIRKVSFPHHPVSGKLHGMDFTLKTTSFRNGDLKIRSLRFQNRVVWSCWVSAWWAPWISVGDGLSDWVFARPVVESPLSADYQDGVVPICRWNGERVRLARCGRRPAERSGECSRRDVANGDRAGRAPRFALMPETAWSRRLVPAKCRNAARRRKRGEDGSIWESNKPLRFPFVSILRTDPFTFMVRGFERLDEELKRLGVDTRPKYRLEPPLGGTKLNLVFRDEPS